MGALFDLVVQGLQSMDFASLIIEGFLDEEVGDAWILWQERTVEISTNAVVIADAFGEIFAVIAGAAGDGTEW